MALAPLTQVLAYVLDYYKRSSMTTDEEERGMKVVNDHNREVYGRYKSSLIRGRDFLNRQIWRTTSADGFFVVATPMESDDHAALPNVVRGRFPLAMKLRGHGGMTDVEYVIQIDFGGQVPSFVTNLYMKSSLAYVTAVQVHFQALRRLVEFDEEDGKAVGEVLVTKTDAEQHHGKGETRMEARVGVIMENHKGLKELREKYEWFEVLLTKVVANKLRPAGDSRAKLCNMSEKEAKVIGGALASCIAANLTAPAAVDEWILRYPAMGELEREYVHSPRPSRE
jgi:hypothetical protein